MSSSISYSRLRIVVVFALSLIVFASTVSGSLAAGEPPGFTDPAELETFLDSVIEAQLRDKNIAGAAVAVVKDGRLFFAKGYGYSDLEKQAPVNPDTTVFHVGSVAKLLTWTAVMQLVEQGRLDLDADINQYLDFQIPDTFPEPITLKHLLTHTPGFENTPFGIAAAEPSKLVPNGAWLADNIPARRWAPGQIPAYSNYGAGLAGYIVERVAELPYEVYVQQHILSPLGMTHSSLQQPVPEALAADQARGYRYINGSHQPGDAEYISVVPAGGLQASATDMARFLIAHLGNGRYCQAGCAGSEVRILGEPAAQQMQSRLWTADERINGLGHGFIELSQNGHRVVGHSGDTSLFHSLLAMLPEQNAGVFVSYNSQSSSGVPYDLLEAFMDRYYPDPAAGTSKPLPDSAARAAHYAGTYQMVRLQYGGGGKILGLLYLFSIKAGENGELIADQPLGGSGRYVEVAPLLFDQVGGDGRLAFREDDQGNIAYLFFGDLPQIALKKVAWYETRAFNLGLLGVAALLFLSVLVVGLAHIVRSLFKRNTQLQQPAPARLAPFALVIMALVGLTLEVGLFLAVTDSWAIASGDRSLLTTMGALAILAVLLACTVVVLTILAWRAKWWRTPARIHYTLAALASLALVWFLTYWNQVGWQWW